MARSGACLLVGLCAAAVHCTHAEVVEHIPNYGAPPTVHRSGFIEVDEASGTSLFYYYVESETKPDTDPIIWWMNGGPGASSLIGLLSENGPLILNEQQEFMENPFSWNRYANLLYVEFAPGVGYSFCDNSSRADTGCPQSSSDCSPCRASDSSVTQQNLVFIQKFLQQHSLEGQALFLAGESYAGVYVPALAHAMVEKFADTSLVNLQGIWVTDPCTDNWAQSGWLDITPKFCWHRGIITSDVYYGITDPMLGCVKGKSNGGDGIRHTITDACKKAWRTYDIATAGLGGSSRPRPIPNLPQYLDPLNAYGAVGSVDVEAYFTRADVRHAFHATASPNEVYHSALGNNGYRGYVREYDACGDIPGGGGPSPLALYRQLLAAKKNGKASAANLRSIVISSGEEDPVVAMEGTEAAVKALGLRERPGGPRRPWFYKSEGIPIQVLETSPVQFGPSERVRGQGLQVGGFVNNYDTGIEGMSLMFVTVRNSGHMVPAYAPQRAFDVLERVVLNYGTLSALLPADWENTDDDTFYGHGETSGLFTKWSRETRVLAQERVAHPWLQHGWFTPPHPAAETLGELASGSATNISFAYVGGAFCSSAVAVFLMTWRLAACWARPRDLERSLLS